MLRKQTYILVFIVFSINVLGQNTITYQYDDLGRLTQVSYDENQSSTYTYDDVGNRTYENILSGVPENRTVENVTVGDGDSQCYDATSTITVAGSGTTVEIEPGGEAVFIAGNKVIFKPGFKAYTDSYVHAFITTNEDYCTNYSMAPVSVEVEEELEEDSDKPQDAGNMDSEIVIYPNPTNGSFTIDFRGKTNTGELALINFQGSVVHGQYFSNQMKMKLDISNYPDGMYILLMRISGKVYTQKIVKN